jgi:hypothetical protein
MCAACARRGADTPKRAYTSRKTPCVGTIEHQLQRGEIRLYAGTGKFAFPLGQGLQRGEIRLYAETEAANDRILACARREGCLIRRIAQVSELDQHCRGA